MRSRSIVIMHVLFGTLAALSGTAAGGGEPQWNIVKPSTTGIPREQVRFMAFDPQGNLWVAGRWIDWGEAGLARLPASDVPYQALPAGGFDTSAWTVWSNVHHPIPSVFLNDIEFAADGIVWIASDGGLTRFDPGAATPEAMWHTYNAANSPLILDEVRSLDADSQGNLWLTNVNVQTTNGALFRFNPAANQWTQYTVGQQLPWTAPWFNVNSVHVGADDHVWLTHMTDTGLAEYDGASWVLHPAGAQLDDMLEDLQGNIWITSAASGLWKWNGASFDNWPTLGNTITTTGLGLDPATGLVWVATWYGNIYTMAGGTTPVFFVNAENIPHSIAVRPGGEVWISNYGGNGTMGTVRHYTAGGQLLERFNSFNSGLPWDLVDRIQTDSQGNLWFATGEGGLSRFDGVRWRNWGAHNDLSEPYPFVDNEPMYTILEDDQGDIWMGGNGVARWDPDTGAFTGFWNWQNTSLPVDDMNSLARQPDGTIWVGTGFSGAYHYDPLIDDWVQVARAPLGWSANEVQDMATDGAGNLWILTSLQLHRLTPQGAWSTWDSTNSPLTLGTFFFDLEPDLSAGVWVGVEGNLLHFDGTTWMSTTQAQAGWPGVNVTGIAIRASDGLMAVTTQQQEVYPYTGGVSVFDGAAWTHWTMENSPLTHWQASAPCFDADGHLWVSPMSEGVVQILIGPSAIPGDLDGNGTVGVNDLLSLLAAWGPCPDSPAPCTADIDGDGSVNVTDLLTLLANWG